MASMASSTLDKGKQPLQPAHPLNTPSATPPPPAPPRRKSTSRPPPPKRARTDSAPSTPGPSRPPSAAAGAPDVAAALDPGRDEAWRASSRRLLDVWAQLAEKYNTPLDQDDIIDLRAVKLVKDRGVTRRLKKVYEIGHFGSPARDDVDGSSEDGNDPEEEFDAFPRPEPKVPIKLEMEKTNRVLPPFTEMNPTDADDLKAFLEEEERRRALGGIDDGEDEVVEEDEDEDGSDWVTDDTPEPLRRPLRRPVIDQSDRPLTPPNDSEDEFAKWDIDDEGPTPGRSQARAEQPVEAAVDMIDLVSPSPSPPGTPLSRRQPSPRVPTPPREPSPPIASSSKSQISTKGPPTRNNQLQTPPLSSQSSSVGGGTPEADLFGVSEPASPPILPPTRRVSMRRKSVAPEAGPSTRPGPSQASTSKLRSPRKAEFAVPAIPDRIKLGRVRDATPGPLSGRIPEVVITRRPTPRLASAAPVKTGPPAPKTASAAKRPLVASSSASNVLDKGKGKAISLEASSSTVTGATSAKKRPLAASFKTPDVLSNGKGKAAAPDTDPSDDEPLPPPRRRAKSLIRELRASSPVKPTEPIRATASSPPRPGPKLDEIRRPNTVNHGQKRKRVISSPSASSSEDESPLSARHRSPAKHQTLRPVSSHNGKGKGKATQQSSDDESGGCLPSSSSRTYPHHEVNEQILVIRQHTIGQRRTLVARDHVHELCSRPHLPRILRQPRQPRHTTVAVAPGHVHLRNIHHLSRHYCRARRLSTSLKPFIICRICLPVVVRHRALRRPFRRSTAPNSQLPFLKPRSGVTETLGGSPRARLVPTRRRHRRRLATARRGIARIRTRSRSTRRTRPRRHRPRQARLYLHPRPRPPHPRRRAPRAGHAASRAAGGCRSSLLRRIVPRCAARLLGTRTKRATTSTRGAVRVGTRMSGMAGGGRVVRAEVRARRTPIRHTRLRLLRGASGGAHRGRRRRRRGVGLYVGNNRNVR